MTYNVTDSQGNAATEVILVVSVVDTTAPVITLDNGLTMDLECGTPFSDPGHTITDCEAGLVATIDSSAVDHETLGDYNVTYNVTDSQGNAATEVILVVSVVDTTAPVITLDNGLTMDLECGTPFADPGHTITDCEAGLVATIDSSAVDHETLGDYNVTYNVTDSEGNAATEVILVVSVVDTTAPVITLDNGLTMDLECGTPFSDPGHTITDCEAGLVATIDSSAVDHETLGD